MSLELVHSVMRALPTTQAWMVSLVKIKNSKRNGTTYATRGITLSPQGTLSRFVSDLSGVYVDDEKGFLNKYTSVVDYDGNTEAIKIYKLQSSSQLISDEYTNLVQAIPRYENENWTFTELLYEAPYLKSYQDEEDEEDEEADCLEYIDNTDKIIYLYYQDDKCVGKVKLRKNWNRYAYIEDIAVCKDFRGQGIGSALINISIEWAKHKNLHGLMLETQDNNLIACKFYHNCGFKIGSVDTMLYANFENNFEKAVFWYLRF